MGISSLHGAHQEPHTLTIIGPRNAFIEAPLVPSKQPKSIGFALLEFGIVAQETTLPAT